MIISEFHVCDNIEGMMRQCLCLSGIFVTSLKAIHGLHLSVCSYLVSNRSLNPSLRSRP